VRAVGADREAEVEAAEVREAEAVADRAAVALAEAGTDAGAPVGDTAAVAADAHTKTNSDRIKGPKRFLPSLKPAILSKFFLPVPRYRSKA
jgi:hypothetical protein